MKRNSSSGGGPRSFFSRRTSSGSIKQQQQQTKASKMTNSLANTATRPNSATVEVKQNNRKYRFSNLASKLSRSTPSSPPNRRHSQPPSTESDKGIYNQFLSTTNSDGEASKENHSTSIAQPLRISTNSQNKRTTLSISPILPQPSATTTRTSIPLPATLTSTSTKSQKSIKVMSAAAAAKNIPKALMRTISRSSRKHSPPSLISDPSLSPPAVNCESHTFLPEQLDTMAKDNIEVLKSNSLKEFKNTDNEPTEILDGDSSASKKKSGSSRTFMSSTQQFANSFFRRSRNRTASTSSTSSSNPNGSSSGAQDSTEVGYTYESFPDPGPEGFVDVDTWGLPGSLTATEEAGGVLQMIPYDGILINGVRVN